MGLFLDLLRNVLLILAAHGVVFGLLAFATKRNGFIKAVGATREEFSKNLALAIFNSVLLAPFFEAPSGALHATIGTNPTLASFWEGTNEVLVLAAAAVLIDFAAYWRHRLEHEPGLWRFHATHHSDTAIHWLTVHRKHPVGKLLSVLIDLLPVVALGFPLWSIAAAQLLRTFWGYLAHADVPWTFGRFGKVMISPAAHRLHHIRDERLMGTNYSNTFAFLDVMFGTYVDPTPHVNCETGIEEGPRSFWGELARPWEARYRDSKPSEQVDEAAA
ncbi:sterol desaturase family protein [Qipengyuania soli]|uniref:Sterol desaturase family protein n=1 Tax=Qipengyuania soli TaxID=2782568 RepID=A0A7S8IW47_9SPHN|nr:sterol desaturase family protein [Qipengyuania soli]QPD00291.1 sterol desaturase family protein [Qipengyuania soli]